MTNRPNILYLHSHDTGRYIQPYGYPVPTPNLQRLAEKGVLFRNSFTVSPTCSPSRSALLTGLYPHNNGMTGLAHRGWHLNDYNQHAVHRLKGHGYFTALFGTQHVVDHTQVDRLGYDVAMPGGSIQERTQNALNFLQQDGPSQPFFVSIGFEETHREFLIPGTIAGDSYEDPRYTRPPAPLPDTPAVREDMAGFITTARRLDANYGRILQALDETGLAENTLVICTTDHGIAFPGMKCSLTDHGMGVLLIMRGPGGFNGGKVIDAMVTHLDILPTLYDLLELPLPVEFEGSSLLPLIHTQTTTIHPEVFGEVSYHATYEPQRAVRTERYKYIRRFGPEPHCVLANCDDSSSKFERVAHHWIEQPLPGELLFDLIFDPNESHNLASDPRMKAVLLDMRARLARWMQDTNDPLRQGKVVPPPDGAQINELDAVSPGEPTVLAAEHLNQQNLT